MDPPFDHDTFLPREEGGYFNGGGTGFLVLVDDVCPNIHGLEYFGWQHLF